MRVPSLCSPGDPGTQTVRTWGGRMEHVSGHEFYIRKGARASRYTSSCLCTVYWQCPFFLAAESTCMQCWLENFPTRPNPSTLRLCTTKWKKMRWIPFRTTCHPVGWFASLVYVFLSSLSLYIIHLNRFLSCILTREALLGWKGSEYPTSDKYLI